MKAAKPLLVILEDVPELREWLSTLISDRHPDWRLRTAGTALEFRRTVERERPVLVLLDEVLGAGEDLASLLKFVEAEEIPTALMSGMDPAHRDLSRLPSSVMRRMIKPDWASGKGVDAFLKAVDEVIVLTTSGRIG